MRRSIQIDGNITSISLDPPFWDALDEMAKQSGVEWQVLTRKILNSTERGLSRSAAIREALLSGTDTTTRQNNKKTYQANWIIDGPDIETQKLTTQSVRVLAGRNSDNDIVLSDPLVSRRHALFVHDNKKWWVIDLKSTNGIELNNEKISLSPLKRGDVITLGDTNLRKR